MTGPVRLAAGAALVAALGLLLPGPLGHLAAYAAIGWAPGWGAAAWLLPRSGRSTQALLGVVLAPLVSAVVAWLVMASGGTLLDGTRAAVVLGVVSLAAAAMRRDAGGAQEEGEPALDRVGWAVLIGAALFVALLPLASEWVRVRSDGWIHAGITWDIREHGVPPIDPRFAGMKLNYVWFYNLFLAMVTVSHGERDPFVTMAMMNVVDMAALVALTWRLAGNWGRTADAARGAVLLLVLGLNAGAWLLWPLRLLRAMHGEQRGWGEVLRLVREVQWDTYRVQHFVVSAPFAWMVNSWDKWTLGSSIGYTYLFIPFHLWSLLRAWKSGEWGWWILVALSATAMILFHGVVGLSVLPVTAGALLLLWIAGPRLRGAPPRWQSATGGVLLALGGLAALPYLRSITAGWDPSQSGMAHRYLQIGWIMPWTLLTSCGVAGAFALAGLRRWWGCAEPSSALLPVWLAGMTAFALVVHLPENNETKFVWQVFVLLAVIGGPAAWDWLVRPRHGARKVAWAAATALVFLVPSALFFQGMWRDRPERSQPELAEAASLDADERAFYRWVRQETPSDAVFVDDRSRDHLMVLGRRRLLAGTKFDAARAAFPVDEMARRRAIEADLYGPLADPEGDLAGLRAAVTRMRAVHPVSACYILYRRDARETRMPRWEQLRRAAPELETVYEAGGFVVLRLEVP